MASPGGLIKGRRGEARGRQGYRKTLPFLSNGLKRPVSLNAAYARCGSSDLKKGAWGCPSRMFVVEVNIMGSYATA